MVEWFEDLSIGMLFKGGSARITEEEIKEFAAKYDPQPFHLDVHAARKTIFKGLAASGWLTAATAMRLVVEARPFGAHPIVGLGVDELRWPFAVRPGDVLRLNGEVVDLIASNSRPQGTVSKAM